MRDGGWRSIRRSAVSALSAADDAQLGAEEALADLRQRESQRIAGAAREHELLARSQARRERIERELSAAQAAERAAEAELGPSRAALSAAESRLAENFTISANHRLKVVPTTMV